MLSVHSSIPGLCNYFEELYTAAPSALYSELRDDVQLLHMWRYIDVYGIASEPEKMLFMVTSRGKAFIESHAIPQLQPEIYAKIREIVTLSLEPKEDVGKAGYDQLVAELSKIVGTEEREQPKGLREAIDREFSRRLPEFAKMFAERLSRDLRVDQRLTASL